MSGNVPVLRLCTRPMSRLAVLSLALTLCQATLNPAFVLTSTPEQVKRGSTEDVTLRCNHNHRTRSQLSKVNAIQLLRKDERESWALLAETTGSNVPETSDSHASVSGDISGGIQSVFLVITWPLATENTMGVFRCDVIGVDFNEENVTETSLLHEITDLFITDIMNLLLESQNKLKEDVNDIRAKQMSVYKDVKDKIETLAKGMNSLIHEVNSIKKNLDSVKEEVDLVETNVLGFWPGGSYALLQSIAGCPQSSLSLGGNESYYKIHTESNRGTINKDSSSPVLPAGTSSKKDEKNFMTMRFCESNDPAISGHWPEGAYCINKIQYEPCPPGFKTGSVELDGEDEHNSDQHAGNVVLTSTRHFPQVGFCCMTSGDPEVPVILPTRTPFLLYRRGGSCQTVLHMNSSESALCIDTEDNDNGDKYDGIVPDMDVNKNSTTTFHLCYYS